MEACYLTDAMMPYVECTGFFGNKVVMFVVNMPYLLIYLPLIGVVGFFREPRLILLGVLAWAPIGCFTWYLVKYPNKDNSAKARSGADELRRHV